MNMLALRKFLKENGVMEPEEFADKMKNLDHLYEVEKSDPEAFHCEADRFICELLRALGYSDGVDVFENAETWCA